MNDNTKLTPKQNEVIWYLQHGYELITDSEMPGAIVGGDERQFHIGNRLFWNLHNLGLIRQGDEREAFYFKLTRKGWEIPTRQPKELDNYAGQNL